jgi:hypothetical protein
MYRFWWAIIDLHEVGNSLEYPTFNSSAMPSLLNSIVVQDELPSLETYRLGMSLKILVKDYFDILLAHKEISTFW